MTMTVMFEARETEEGEYTFESRSPFTQLVSPLTQLRQNTKYILPSIVGMHTNYTITDCDRISNYSSSVQTDTS